MIKLEQSLSHIVSNNFNDLKNKVVNGLLAGIISVSILSSCATIAYEVYPTNVIGKVVSKQKKPYDNQDNKYGSSYHIDIIASVDTWKCMEFEYSNKELYYKVAKDSMVNITCHKAYKVKYWYDKNNRVKKEKNYVMGLIIDNIELRKKYHGDNIYFSWMDNFMSRPDLSGTVVFRKGVKR